MIKSHRSLSHAPFPAKLSVSIFNFEQSTAALLHMAALGDGDSTDEVCPWGTGLAHDASRLEGPQSSMVLRSCNQWSICLWDLDFQILNLSPADQLSSSSYSGLPFACQKTLNLTSLPVSSVLTQHTRRNSEQAVSKALPAGRWKRSSTNGFIRSPCRWVRFSPRPTPSPSIMKATTCRAQKCKAQKCGLSCPFLPATREYFWHTSPQWCHPSSASPRFLVLVPDSLILIVIKSRFLPTAEYLEGWFL